MNEIEALAILAHIPFLGSVKIRQLIQHYGTATAALELAGTDSMHWHGIGDKIRHGLTHWKSSDQWKRNLEAAHEENATIIPFTSPQYPQRLLELPDLPLLLYVKGELKKSDSRCIAMIGTRNMSVYGCDMAKKIAEDLAAMGFTIISGLARGIDTAAHCGALAKGRTIAVLGSGLKDIYPKENLALAQAISNKGCLISEFPMMTPPDKQNFPQRNRIVSGMSMGIVLIEAPLKSGAMITMDRGWSQKRKLFALPGRAEGDSFRGNHYLIKKGMAHLIENAEDVALTFDNLFSLTPQNSAAKGPLIPLEKDEEAIYKALSSEELTIEEIIQRTQCPAHKLSSLLMGMVIKKAIKELPGKIYKKI